MKPQKSTTSKRAAKPVAEPTRPRSSRATAATPKKYTEVNESADEDSPPTTRKPRTTGRNAKPAKDGKKSARKGRGKKAGSDSDTEGEGEDAEMALHADEGAGEDTVDPPVSKAQSKGRDGGRKRGSAAVVDDVQGEVDEEEEYAPLVTTPGVKVKANLNIGIGSPRRSAPRQSPLPLKKSSRSRPRRLLLLRPLTRRLRLRPKTLQRKPPKQKIRANLEKAFSAESR